MKINKRGLSAAVASVAAASMLAIATPAHASTTITVWADDMVAKSIEAVVADYEDAQGVNVDVTIKDFGAVRDDFITASGTNSAPDILAGAHDWTGKLAAAGAIAPINLGAKKSQFTSLALAAGIFNGKNYMVPMATENIALIRNKSVKATAAKTWAQVQTAGVEVGFDATGGDPYHFYPLQSSFGAPVFKSNAKGWTTTLGMGGTAGANFAKWLAKNPSKLTADLGWNDLICNLATGKVAYWITGPWATNAVRDGVDGTCAGLGKNGYAIDAFPSVGGKPAQQFAGVRGFYLSAKSTNKVAATAFLLGFLSTPKVQYQIFLDGGRVPASKAALALAGSDKNIAGFAAAGKNAVPMPNLVAMDSVWDKWGKAEASIITGKSKNPTGDWAAMVKAIQKIINAG
jgi:arabinogalactan oligomer/maltooligosaccharide transport system substrate-binding protein